MISLKRSRKKRSRSRSGSRDRTRRSRSRERYKERKRSRSKSQEKTRDKTTRKPRERERERERDREREKKRKRSESSSSHSVSSSKSRSRSPGQKKKDKDTQRKRRSRSRSNEKKTKKERPRSKERDKDRDKDRKRRSKSRNRSSSPGSRSKSKSPDKEQKKSKSSRDKRKRDEGDSSDRTKESKKSKEVLSLLLSLPQTLCVKCSWDKVQRLVPRTCLLICSDLYYLSKIKFVMAETFFFAGKLRKGEPYLVRHFVTMGRDTKSRKKRSRSRSGSRDRTRRSRSRERYKERKRSRSKSQEKTRDKTTRKPRERERERERDREREKKRKRSESSSSHSVSSSKSRSRSPGQKKKDKDTQRKRRSRSRSNEKKTKKERPRSKERDKDRDKDRKRRSKSRNRSSSPGSRSKSKSPDKEQKKSKSSRDKRKRDEGDSSDRTKESKKSKESKKDVTSSSVDVKPNEDDKDAEQKRLEEEMQKRRERIEAWRAQRKKEQEEKQKSEETVSEDQQKKKKAWSLEDDDDDDEEDEVQGVKEEQDAEDEPKLKKAINNKKDNTSVANGKVKEELQEDDDTDPLDAFMADVNKEVKKVNALDQKKRVGKAGKATVIHHVVTKTKKRDPTKGELMENDQDAMEYSSEEDVEEETIESTYAHFKTKKKKDLQAVDHEKVYYSTFRKDFYVEVPELARMTPEEVDELRGKLENIRVRGKDCPKPVKTWAQTGVSLKILDVLKKNGYEKPTPIQAQAIPTIMSGRDMIGIAKTGSGKTLAFLLPMYRHVLDQPDLDREDGPIGIIMTPTRELALQIYRECKKFCKPLNLRVVCVYGGTGISEQIAELKRGAEIIVCTPGRMIDMLTANNGRVTNCRRCTYLVLDEADRMFDMGFEPQVMRIIDCIRPDKQTVMFSATFPRQMEALARKILTKPIEIQVGGRSIVCSDVQQNVIVIEEDDKFLKLLELLGIYQEQGSALVFVEKQEKADMLFKDLLKTSYPCLSLHGGMDQFDRDSTIADFKNGVTNLMIATSVAARGLDVKQLILVVNYDCPNHYEDYVHRCGRTGRAGRKGTSYTFVTSEQGRHAGDVIKALESSTAEVPDDLRKLWHDYTEERKAEGKNVVKNSGFTGKGFKFNDEEAAKVNEAKKIQKWALGLQDSDDEAEAEEKAVEEIDKQLDAVFSKGKPHIKKAAPVGGEQIKGEQQAKLNLATSIAAKINQKIIAGTNNMDPTQQAASQIIKGGTVTALTGLGLAKQLAEKIHGKIGYEAPVEETKQDEKQTENEQRYEDEVEINDFPQTARWKVTSKVCVECFHQSWRQII
ncbi:probable ATP-dependent RNA helicase DDX46 [Orbicella faveolata]|uniref:probable ATP-dependent RNA helicase DDX46 n=2 Tax=Orbicella faveolata TaxID=48498 RepID=UPI0009E46797|nr:probable ATP-dependent RNA helicase DDX46 [Orbicella faveolata]